MDTSKLQSYISTDIIAAQIVQDMNENIDKVIACMLRQGAVGTEVVYKVREPLNQSTYIDWEDITFNFFSKRVVIKHKDVNQWYDVDKYFEDYANPTEKESTMFEIVTGLKYPIDVQEKEIATNS